jgi:hypothetical protein
VETAKIAVDSCYVLRQFLTPLPLIDFREFRGLVYTSKYPSEAPALMKYGDIVRDLASRGHNWFFYDTIVTVVTMGRNSLGTMVSFPACSTQEITFLF